MIGKMKTIAAILFLAAGFLFAGCDKGKKPYEDAEMLFGKSDYAAAKSKAAEVIQNTPKSKYLPQARAILEKIERVESLSKMATVSIEKGDYVNGIEIYNEILSIHPDNKIIVSARHDAEITLLRLERLASELVTQLDILESTINRFNSINRYNWDLLEALRTKVTLERSKYREKLAVIYKIPGGRNYMKIQFKKSGIDEKLLPDA